MYAVVIASLGNGGLYVPCGNNGLQKLHNKTMRGWLAETTCFRKNAAGQVYVIRDFTQTMCEMNNGKLCDCIMKNHVAILPRC